MDTIAQYNQARWAALVQHNAIFTRPRLDLNAQSAREMVDPEGRLDELAGKQVLCLASGGGQQSVAFALLGAQVTVVDLAAEQLQQDVAAAHHYGVAIATVQADMRDLSALPAAAYDLVYHPYSLNFVPEPGAVFAQVARVLRPGGAYYVMCANPAFAGLTAQDWDGNGYPLRHPYADGWRIEYADEPWVFRGESPAETVGGPVEYRHTLSALLNGLLAAGFLLRWLTEENLGEPDFSAPPGSTEHFTAVAPPWLKLWTVYRPDFDLA
jgi:2-polyprenyl-3-methyl-5-hydroxy-6-metoxy-1,4-benzoquinol methylase